MSSTSIPGEYNWFGNMDVRDKARINELDPDMRAHIYHIIDNIVIATVRFERSKMDVTSIWNHIYTLEKEVDRLKKEIGNNYADGWH